MRARAGFTFWIKSAQALLLAIAVCFTLGASGNSARIDRLSHQLMCQCGCAQLLGECDHVGCPDRDKELSQLRSDVASGLGDPQILDAFAVEYGATVLAAPTKQGFDLVAGIAPCAVFGAARRGTSLLIRHWNVSRRDPAAQVAAAGSAKTPEMDALRDKIRRETGDDGGF